jgi:hypothetical protein
LYHSNSNEAFTGTWFNIQYNIEGNSSFFFVLATSPAISISRACGAQIVIPKLSLFIPPPFTFTSSYSQLIILIAAFVISSHECGTSNTRAKKIKTKGEERGHTKIRQDKAITRQSQTKRITRQDNHKTRQDKFCRPIMYLYLRKFFIL